MILVERIRIAEGVGQPEERCERSERNIPLATRASPDHLPEVRQAGIDDHGGLLGEAPGLVANRPFSLLVGLVGHGINVAGACDIQLLGQMFSQAGFPLRAANLKARQ
ncbi:MAG: hypothetical protein WAT66_03860 [Actinomycetota bacterium]